MDLTIPNDDFAICHGSSRFVKTDKIADLRRKSKTGQVWSVDCEVVVVLQVLFCITSPYINLKSFCCWERSPQLQRNEGSNPLFWMPGPRRYGLKQGLEPPLSLKPSFLYPLASLPHGEAIGSAAQALVRFKPLCGLSPCAAMPPSTSIAGILAQHGFQEDWNSSNVLMLISWTYLQHFHFRSHMIHPSLSWIGMDYVFLLPLDVYQSQTGWKYWNERYGSGTSAACCRISMTWLPKNLASWKHRPAERSGPNSFVSISFDLPFFSNSWGWID